MEDLYIVLYLYTATEIVVRLVNQDNTNAYFLLLYTLLYFVLAFLIPKTESDI